MLVTQEPEAWEILKDLEKISDEYDSRCGLVLSLPSCPCTPVCLLLQPGNIPALGGNHAHWGIKQQAFLPACLNLKCPHAEQ